MGWRRAAFTACACIGLALCCLSEGSRVGDTFEAAEAYAAHAATSIKSHISLDRGQAHHTIIDTRTDEERHLADLKKQAIDSELRDPSLFRALSHSFFMILATEVGDETFIVAALMAMRHPKLVVFAGAISALIIMTVISTAMGYIVPSLISRRATGYAAGCLYTCFGIRLMYIAYISKPNETCEDEIHEVEEKLAGAGHKQSRFRRILSRFCTPIFLEAFILTFLAEWGDRSQIATITLAAHQNPWGVTVGAIVGHSLCTGAACVGGELLARKISPRAVALVGGLLFLLFAAHQFLTTT